MLPKTMSMPQFSRFQTTRMCLIPPERSPADANTFLSCVLGHLRDVKDPLLASRAVRSLPPMQRAAVVHRYVFDLTYEDVGRALGCSEEAARANAYEGRRKLRSMMGGPGGSGPAKRSEAEQAAALPRATRPAGGGARRSFRAEGAR